MRWIDGRRWRRLAQIVVVALRGKMRHKPPREAVLAGTGIISLTVFVAALWNKTPDFYKTATDQGAAVAQTRTGILIGTAGLVAFVGALLTLVETRRANKQEHIREFYNQAIGHLGASTVDVRLGGVYTMERLANDSPYDQRSIVEVLSAFVRVRSTDPGLRPAPRPAPWDMTEIDPPTQIVQPTVDVRAAITVLARLPDLDGVPRADLTGADLTGPAALDHLRATQLNLSSVDLSNAHLKGAHLNGANLADAVLNRADLTGAVLTGADLTGADLTGAVLIGTDFSDAVLNSVHFSGATVISTIFNRADLLGAKLYGTNLLFAKGLQDRQVALAWGDSRTQLPSDVTWPAHWNW